MYIALVGANSPSKLASRPVRYVFYDETDKFPAYSGKEGSPIELAGERTKNYHNSKEIEASSPTYSDGHIWKSFLNADVRKSYFVPCPHCRKSQILKLGQIKWPEELNEPARKYERETRVLTESWYECEFCGERIYDMDKSSMLLQGEWLPVIETAKHKLVLASNIPDRPRHVAYSLSSLYSPWVTFGQVAQKFLNTKDDQAKFMNFVNGWLAEPWEAQATKLQSDIVFKRQGTHPRGEVPEKAQLLTCGIDVQMDHFWWVIRAWGPKLTSWLVDFGTCETWAELDDMLDREYTSANGEPVLVHLAFVDSGDRTDEVYQYCATRPNDTFPCKGSSNRMLRAPFTESKVDKDGFGNMRLFIVDGHYYKSFIAGRLQKENDQPGAFMVFNAEGEERWLRQYAEQLCSEHLVKEEDKKGRVKDVWKPVTSHAANHLLDAEVYAIAAAERAGVRYLREEAEE
jgi:phage terminase large subunit GpA-like protein